MEEKKKKSNKGLCIIVIVLAVAIIGLTGFVYYKENLEGKKTSGSKENNNTETKHNSVESETKQDSYRMDGNSISAFDLYFLQLENNKTNVVYSPLSIKYALEMLAEGADGDTKTQLNNIIGDYAARKYDNNSNMTFTNALFIKDSYKDDVKQDYVDKLSTKYNADVKFDAFSSASNINKYVSDNTFKLINNFVDDDTVKDLNVMLINALAINMNWVNKLTPESFYHVSYAHENYAGGYVVDYHSSGYDYLDFDGVDDKVSVLSIAADINRYDVLTEVGEENMRATVSQSLRTEGSCGKIYDDEEEIKSIVDSYVTDINKNYKSFDKSTDFSFYTDDNVKVFAKELKKSNNVTLEYVAIMPTTDSLENYIKNLDSSKVSELLGKLKEVKYESFDEGYVTSVRGKIPVFNFDYQLDLITDLKNLGITNVFDPDKADLSKITDDLLYIGSASHKATIELSDEGIKAAAATEEGGLGDAICGMYQYDVPTINIDLTFNKPYMFLIRDKATGEVWFAGSIYEPTKYVEEY